MSFENKLRFFHTEDLNSSMKTWRKVFPLGKKTYEHKKEKKEVFYRQKKKGDYVFTDRFENGNKITDFTFFNEINKNNSLRCVTRYIVTQKNCNGYWKTFHVGKFTSNDGKYDLDKCKIEIRQNLVDQYSCLKENKNVEYNMLTVGPIITTISPVNNNYEFLYKRYYSNNCGTIGDVYFGPNPSSWGIFFEDCSDLLLGTGIVKNLGLAQIEFEDNPHDLKYSGSTGAWVSNHDAVNSHDDLRAYNGPTDTQFTLSGTNFLEFKAWDLKDDVLGWIEVNNSVPYFNTKNIATGFSSSINLFPSPFPLTPIPTIYKLVLLPISSNNTYYVINSLPNLIIQGVVAENDGTVDSDTIVTGFGGYVVYWKSSDENLRVRFGASNIVIHNSTDISEIEINGDWLTFIDASGDVYKYSLSNSVKTQIGNGNSFIKSTDIYSVFFSGLNLILHELLTGINVVIGVESVNEIDIINNYVAWSTLAGGLMFFNINSGIKSVITIAGGYGRVCLNEDTLGSHNGTNYDEYSLSLNIFLLSYGSSQNGFIDFACGGGYSIIIQNGVSPFFPNNNKIVSIKRGVANENRILIWYREKKSTICLGGINTSPTGNGWLVENSYCGTTGISEWVRNPSSLSGSILVLPCDCSQFDCVASAPPSTGNFIEIAPCDINDPRVFYWQIPADISYDRNRLLIDVIEGLVNHICPEIKGVISDFFQWNPENETLINYVTKEVTEVNFISLSQKSDIKRPNSSESATIGQIKWSTIVDWLRVQFEVYWFLDENNYLRFEHISFITGSLGLDLTKDKFDINQKNKRKFSYAKQEMPRSEKFSCAEQEGVDFVGYPIDYKDSNGKFSLCVTEDEDSNDLSDLSVDLSLAQSNPDFLDDEGFFMMANTFDGTNYNVILSFGKITGDTIINGPLSWSSLHENYKKWNRILNEGFLNNSFTKFKTIQKFKKQNKFSIPLCCSDEFDPIETIITSLGNAEVELATIDFRDDTINLKLKYE